MEGNQQKMREALDRAISVLERYGYANTDCRSVENICKNALSSHPRNCDVGTAAEQIKRFREFCQAEKCGRYRCMGGSKSICIDRCAIAWAQTPYEANEGCAK